tara:strand:+ start:4589 stop:5041 length:453 start_codon:yes stop_codon:yes gene_type:complete
MPDKSLNDRTFKVSDKVIEKIKLALDSFDGSRTTEGYERANNMVKDPIISLSLLKKINHFFRNADEKSWSYKLTGGDLGKKFFSILEDKVRDGENSSKKAKSRSGMENIYKDKHTKTGLGNPTYVNVPGPPKTSELKEEVKRIKKLINLN